MIPRCLAGTASEIFRGVGPTPKADALVTRFASLADLVAWRDRVHQSGVIVVPEQIQKGKVWARAWTGKQGLRPILTTGSGPQDVAERIERRVQALQVGATPAQSLGFACAGLYPVVPIALGGDPEAMRVRAQDASHAAPVRVFLCLTTSHVVTEEACADVVGTIVSAIAALQDVRPVELIGYTCAQGDDGPSWFACVPIDMESRDYRAIACFCLATLARTTTLAMYHANHPCRVRITNKWAWDWPTAEAYRRALGAEPQDVVLPLMLSRDGNHAEMRAAMEQIAAESGVTLDLGAS